MWHTSSTRAHASRRSVGSVRGFTLIEAMVSLVILVIVMVVTMTLLFSMRAFAERQANHMAPRQTARQATDYIAHFINSAGDTNIVGANPNPNSIVTHYYIGVTEKRALYNNLTAADNAGGQLGDLGTDILTLAYVNNPASMPIITGPATMNGTGTSMTIKFRGGCGPGTTNNDAGNIAQFKALTGMVTTGANTRSALLLAVDGDGSTGSWQYVELTSLPTSDCSGGPSLTDNVITVSFKGSSDVTRYNPPLGGPRTNFTVSANLVTGVEYVSFRVRNGTLEQKVNGVDANGPYPGLFDPATDNPGTRFTPLVENVEDFQVAYLFSWDPSNWWNASNVDTTATPPAWTARSLSPATAPITIPLANGVPKQDATPAPTSGTNWQYDAAYISGIRLTIVGRSPALRLSSLKLTRSSGYGAGFFRPFAEDHAAGAADTTATGFFERYRMSTTMMFRNRILGG